MTTTGGWQGDLVRLRALEPADAEAFFTAAADTGAERLGERVPFPSSRAETRKWVESKGRVPDHCDDFTWGVEALATGDLVGTVGTHGCDRRNGTFDSGVYIWRSHWRKGYGHEAVRLMLCYCFAELGYQKALAGVYDFNTASLALHAALGFVEEGRLRRNVYAAGAYHDEVLLGITAEEFAELWPET